MSLSWSSLGNAQLLRRLVLIAWEERLRCGLALLLQVSLFATSVLGLGWTGAALDLVHRALTPTAPAPRWPWGLAPPAGLSPTELQRWTFQGHTHYLIIDDVDQIPDTPAMGGPFVGQRPWTSLIGLLSEAGDLGLRVIVTARATGSAHAVMTAPLLRRLNELQATTLMLSGNPQDSGKIRGHRFSRLPAGRAMLRDDTVTR